MRLKYSAYRSKIVKDWERLLPGFKMWSPNHLFRIHGPLVMGICLDSTRNIYEYKPIFHHHCLIDQSETIHLGLAGFFQNENGSDRRITVNMHEQMFKELFDEFTKQYSFIMNSRYKFSNYISYIRDVLSGKHGGISEYLPHVYKNIILTAAYCEDYSYAKTELDVFYSDLKHRTDFNMNIIGSIDRWREKLSSNLDKEMIWQTVNNEKNRLKLVEYIDYGLEFDKPVKLFDL